MCKRILMIGMTMFLSIAVVGCNGNQQSNTLNLQEQLDLGHKYLNELDYEMAIATYMAILDVDAKCVSAYQGITEAYMQKDDYVNALKYAQEGYTNTDDQSLAELIKQIEVLITEAEKIAELKFLFEGHSVDGIWHNEYLKYNLGKEDAAYLQQIIAYAKGENYDKVFEYIQNNQLYNMLVRLEEVYNGRIGGEANIAYRGYKVSMITHKDTYSERNAIYLIPLTEEKGYYFEYSVVESEGEMHIEKKYAVCDCKDGMYNGNLVGKESTDVENTHHEASIKGVMVNGLRQGVWITEQLLFDGSMMVTTMSEYTNGKPKAYMVEPYGTNNTYWVVATREEDGSVGNITEGFCCTPERFEKYRYGIDTNYDMWEKNDGSDWCYRY